MSKPVYRVGISLFSTLGLAALMLLALWPRWSVVVSTLNNANWMFFIGAVLAGLLGMLVRTEIWRVCVRELGPTPSRSHLHAANGVGVLVALFAGPGGIPARMWVLRRLDSCAPPMTTLLVADLPVLVLETGVVGILLVVTAALGNISLLWSALFVCALALSALGVLLFAEKRRAKHPVVAALSILRQTRSVATLSVLVVITSSLGIARIALVLSALGFAFSPFETTIVFVVTGLAGFLPLGQLLTQGAGQVAATTSLGIAGAYESAAGGVILTAAVSLAAIAYSLWSLLVIWRSTGVLALWKQKL